MASRLQRYEEAEAAFRRALVLNDGDDEARVNLGVLKYYEGDMDSARWWLNQAITYNPRNGHAYNALNQVAISEGDLGEAMEQVSMAIELEPSNAYFMNNRGYTWLLMDSLEVGIQDINQSVLLDADNMWAFRNKGVYYLLSGSPETALRYFTQVEESKAFVDELLAYKGLALWEMGQKEEACRSWSNGTSIRAMELRAERCAANQN